MHALHPRKERPPGGASLILSGTAARDIMQCGRPSRGLREPWVVQLCLALALHGLFWLLAEHLVSRHQPDNWQDPPVIISLAPEPPPSPPAREAPPEAPPAPPPPPAPPAKKTVKQERAEREPPAPVSISPQQKPIKKRVAKAPHAPPPAKTAPSPRPAPQRAAGPAQPEMRDDAAVLPATVPPSAVHRPPPAYPERARARGWQGIAVVEVLVDQAGKVREAHLVTSSGHALLDRAALEGVKDWRFRPGRRDRESVPMRVRIPIHFQLE